MASLSVPWVPAWALDGHWGPPSRPSPGGAPQVQIRFRAHPVRQIQGSPWGLWKVLGPPGHFRLQGLLGGDGVGLTQSWAGASLQDPQVGPMSPRIPPCPIRVTSCLSCQGSWLRLLPCGKSRALGDSPRRAGGVAPPVAGTYGDWLGELDSGPPLSP